jgi:Leucine-rich repeat (LRR) protein
MFVKKDLRKVPQILSDATSRINDDASATNGEIITELSFARRAPEFIPGNVSILLSPSHRAALENLLQLSLYDCGLKSLTELQRDPTGVDDYVSFPKLKQLDVGRNPLLVNDSLSGTFHVHFPSLEEVWADNCSFGPSLPQTLLEFRKLQVVRMTGNKLQSLQGGMDKYWPRLKVLALDGNELSEVDVGIGKLQHLQKLHLRQNKLNCLPEGVPSTANQNLTMISLSSNQLKKLPDSLVDVTTLEEVYLNSNEIELLPNGLAKLDKLTKLNLANNKIGTNSTNDDEEGDAISLPEDFVKRFGLPEALSGNCAKDESCVVQMEGNPMADRRRKRFLEEEKEKAKEMDVDHE